jgi:hypothetical protein
MIIKDIPVEESTLFNSLFRHSYKEVLESIASDQSDFGNSDDDDPADYDVNATKKDIEDSEYEGDDDITDEAERHGGVESDIDMDLILAESITKYTLMELCYTIQLENYKYEDIQKISQKLLN